MAGQADQTLGQAALTAPSSTVDQAVGQVALTSPSSTVDQALGQVALTSPSSTVRQCIGQVAITPNPAPPATPTVTVLAAPAYQRVKLLVETGLANQGTTTIDNATLRTYWTAPSPMQPLLAATYADQAAVRQVFQSNRVSSILCPRAPPNNGSDIDWNVDGAGLPVLELSIFGTNMANVVEISFDHSITR